MHSVCVPGAELVGELAAPAVDSATPPMNATLAKMLEPPAVVEPRHRRTYFVMLAGNGVGLVNHVAFLAVFAFFAVTPLAIFNIFSVCVFLLNLVLQKRYGRTLTAMGLASTEVILHQVVAVVFLGWGYGFQYYLIVVPAFLFLAHFERRTIPIAISSLSVGALAWLWLQGQHIGAPHAQLPETARFALYGLNLLSTAVLVSLFSLIYHRTARANEDALMAANEAAQAASQAKSDFLANMSHELRTPLNAIIGYSEMLAESTTDEEVVADLGKIQGSGRHLLGLINGILDLSKIEAGRMRTVSEPFDPHAVLRSIEGMFGPMVADQPVELVLKVDAEIPDQLVGDSMRLRQVLTNLVGNAVKFTEQGSVSVTAGVLDASGETIRLEFVVEDTGIGISPEQLQQVFEPFTQADDLVQHKFGGTGLGLSISRRLVELMDGSFQASSESGSGSRFSFVLPFERVQD